MATLNKKTNKIRIMWLMGDKDHSFHQIEEISAQQARELISKGLVVEVNKATESGDSLTIGENI